MQQFKLAMGIFAPHTPGLKVQEMSIGRGEQLEVARAICPSPTHELTSYPQAYTVRAGHFLVGLLETYLPPGRLRHHKPLCLKLCMVASLQISDSTRYSALNLCHCY
jgi:hypothetical protein